MAPTTKPRAKRGIVLFARRKVSSKILMIFTRQLATLIDSGLPLLRSLNVLAKQERDKVMRNTINKVADSVQSGSTFSDALALHPRIFNDLYVSMVKAGEVGGVLELVLTRLSEFQEKAAKIKNKILAAMVYPVIFAALPLSILNWRRMSWWLWILTAAAVCSGLIFSILRGTDREGFDMIIIAGASGFVVAARSCVARNATLSDIILNRKTLAGAVFISGVVALVLSPVMSANLLRQEHVDHGFSGWVTRTFDRFRDWYGRHLDRTLAARPAVYTVWIGLSLLGALFWYMSPNELAPTEDQGVIFGIVTAPANATIDDTIRYADAAGKIFHDIPDTRFTFQITNPDQGFGGMVLKPWGTRKTPTAAYLPVVQQKLGAIPGIQMFPVMPSALPGSDSFPLSFVIASTGDPERILEFAKQIQQKAMQAGIFRFSDIDTKIDQPQAEIVFDHEKVASLGLDMQQVGADMSASIGGNYVNRFNIAGRSYKVIPQVKRVDRLNPEQLENIYVTGPNNQLVPLSTVATIRHKTVGRSLNRMQQLNAVSISGVPTRSLDAALKFLEDEANKILPKGYVIDYTGESRQLRTEGSKFLPVFMLAIVLIFLVLAAQFNSFRDPFIILLGSVPLAIFGALLFTFLKMPFGKFFTDGWTTTLNIYSQVGLVTLVGLVSKNGILIVQFANERQRQGLGKLAAIAEAARIRLRPIMMTSVATVAGHFPLTLVSGAGAAARNSIGLVLVGGMTIGTIFTLFIVPSLYMLIAKEHHEKSLMDVGWEDAPEDVDLTAELEPALVPDGDGNAWKQG